MIIGISGKIGSGKDTVGKIVQYLNDTHFNPDNGYTFHQYLKETELETQPNCIFEIKKFADKLKDIVCLLIGCTRKDLENQEFKNKELSEDWWYWTYFTFKGCPWVMTPYTEDPYVESDFIKNKELIKLTPRKLLQLLGTDCGRDTIHPNIWVNSLFANYKLEANNIGNYKQELEYGNFPNWIISDVRFQNEAKSIKDRDGVLIRVNRPCVNCKAYNNIACNTCSTSNLHQSETALDDYQDWDYVIDNNDSLESLIEKVKVILEDLKLI